ncbi:MAG: hypothetical protein ACOCSN_05125 [Halanaeroarchaeum sp.]
MAAVPPPSDDDEPDSVTFGIPALDDLLRDSEVAFPVAADDLVAELEDPEIPCDPTGRSIRLSEAIDRADRRRFESRRDLLNELHPVFEEVRGTGGVAGWLKRLLPF